MARSTFRKRRTIEPVVATSRPSRDRTGQDRTGQVRRDGEKEGEGVRRAENQAS